MSRRNPTFWGFFTRFGGTTVTFAATGATYAFFKDFSTNLRESDDSWSAAYGGFCAGAIQGLRRTYPSSVANDIRYLHEAEYLRSTNAQKY